MVILCRHIIQFLLQSIQIRIHLHFPGCERIRRKGTIQAGTRAKRNADIQAVPILVIQLRKKCTLTLRDRDRQVHLLIGSKICFFHIGSNLFLCLSLVKKLHRNLRRTDSGQCSPWETSSGFFFEQTIQMLLECIFRLGTIGKIHFEGAKSRSF